MSKIIACIDGSAYADSVNTISAWAAKATGLGVSLLHVVAPHTEVAKADMSGQIGLGAKSSLLKELARQDQEQAKQDLKQGILILERAKAELLAKDIANLDTLHRRGTLVETITAVESDLVILGKRGEQTDGTADPLGANVEPVIHAIQKPVLVVTKTVKSLKKFLIAYDASPCAKRALDYIASNPLLSGMECHLLRVGEKTVESEIELVDACDKLRKGGFAVKTSIINAKSISDTVATVVADNDIDLLVSGAYGKIKLRHLIIPRTTTALLRQTNIPVLLIR